MAEIIELETKENLTPDEVLAVALRRNFQSVLVIAFDETGDLYIDFNDECALAEANLLLDLAKAHFLRDAVE